MPAGVTEEQVESAGCSAANGAVQTRPRGHCSSRQTATSSRARMCPSRRGSAPSCPRGSPEHRRFVAAHDATSPSTQVVAIRDYAWRLRRGSAWVASAACGRTDPSASLAASVRSTNAEMEPKPQRHIPIWLGTFGKRALNLTGRLADGWIPSLGFAPPDVVPAMRDRVLTAAQQAGREPEEITCGYNMEIRIDARSEEPPSVVAAHRKRSPSDCSRSSASDSQR
jgi:hypothetical protein